MDKINVRGLSRDTRLKILMRIREKYGYRAAAKLLNISLSSMHRYLKGVREIPDTLVYRMLEHITDDELNEILSGGEKLKILGFIREDGSIDYSLATQFIKAMFRDEYLKQLILKLVVNEYRSELKKLLGLSFEDVEFHWDDEFEYFLTNLKRRRKVSTPETLNYYKSIFEKFLEGRRLSERLVDEVVRHRNKWIRNVFRHYIQYLYYKRRIGPEAYGWLMNVVPSRGYTLDIRTYRIKDDEVKETFKFLRENHRIYYIVYRLMLESGARYLHILRMIREFNPDEEVEIAGLGFTKRLVIFRDRGFARYYLGLREGSKRCEWIYFSLDTLEMLRDIAGHTLNRDILTKYVKRHNLVLPKYIRKYSWRLMVKTLGREIARFLQSRFGELKISEARYEDLLSEADEKYPEYLKYLKESNVRN